MAFDAGAIEATLTLNRTPFQRGLDQARADKQRFVDEDFTVDLDLDTAAASGHLNEFRASHSDPLGIGIDLDTARAGVAFADWRRLQEATNLAIGINLGTAQAGVALADWRRLQEATALGVDVNVDTSLASARMAQWRATEGSHTLRADVQADTSGATRSIDGFNSHWKLIAAAIIAATPFIGGAILAGIGAGFVGVAALAEKSNEQVKASWRQLWSDVVLGTRDAANQIVPQIVGAANQIDATVRRVGPDLKQAMAAAGPDIVTLTRGLDDLALNVVPGLTSAMRNAQPVAQGMASLLGTLGTAAGDTFESLGQHSSELGTDLASLGHVVQSVLGLATTVIEVAASAWAQNAGTIDAAINGVTTAASALAQGALPLLSGTLSVVANILQGITTVLGPIAPLLGTVGGAALATWAAFKLADLVTSGVKALAIGVVTLAANFEAGATRAAAYTASMLGVEAESSAAAGAITAAGTAAATAGTEMGIGLSALAGPIGIVAGLAAGAIALGAAFIHTGGDAVQLTGNMDSLTAALERSHGAMDQAAQDALRAEPDFKAVTGAAAQFGVSQQDVADAVTKGGAALDGLRVRLQQIIDAHKVLVADEVTGDLDWTGQFDATGQAAQGVLTALNNLTREYGDASAAAADATTAQNSAAAALANSSQYQESASSTANLLGLSLANVTSGYQSVILASGSASASVAATSEAFLKQQLAVAQAATSMTQQFTQADAQVVQAEQSVADAHRSVEQAARAVADAQQGVVNAAHSLAQAQRSLQDAYTGVATAEQAYTRAQQAELQAQQALNKAREQAIQDLKDLHLQLEDQVLSEQQARVQLFDAEQAAAEQGVTADNARTIAAQEVTATNEAQIKAALSLIGAQNALNDTLNSGDKLRKQVNDADRAGVDGAPGVLSAQNALRNAQDQVASSAAALVKAHQQVEDAQYGVQQASLALQHAHQQVTDAQYQEQRAADQLRVAQQNLRDAQDAASRSLDLHTAAGQRNLGMVLSLWDTITKSGLPIQQQYRTAIDDVASAFGISRDRAADYLKQLGLIPKDFQYSVTAITQVDRNNFDSWLKGVLSTGGYAMDSRNQQKTVGGTGYATGGQIAGPGGPRDDVVPIMASAGEFMQPADAVDYYGVGFMEAVRAKQLPRGGDGAAMPGYASGGLIEQAANSVYTGASLGAAYLATNNARRVMGFPTMPDLPKYDPAGDVGGMVGYTPSAGVAQWAGVILQALSMLGQAPGWLGTVERRMNQESGGNPNAVNRWDSNWKAGHPSVGLMQVIRGTYAAYKGPDVGPYMYGVSVNPLSNVFAGLNYAIHRYGSLAALNRPGGYDNGGLLDPGWTAVYNGTRSPENVRTSQQEDQLLAELQALRAEVQAAGGVHIHQSFNGNRWSPEELAAASSRRAAEAFRGLG
ncbi:transglycosylase SLT domain-containing protein [Amycolatopsis taiwanensis]|uniref:lytic transglycosylase domain-containing protein n=1 Tax=Amycolatopsis taiwanensis TaxID=342230 RepID=UPI00048A0CE7|nr:transglycosylase SLT domain-containing protein [Amycolatopsis taiwanensis]